MTHIIGWYDELAPTQGMESIVYWNHAVNRLIPGADQNDVNLYTVESYIKALSMLPKNGGRFWVQLPYFQVYTDELGKEIVIFEQYAYKIIDAFAHDDRVVGFYLADEPEIWGTEWSSHKDRFDKEAAKRVYRHIKSQNHEKLALMVFCDVWQMNWKFKPTDLVLMTDILGFDYYPYETQAQVDNKGRDYVIRTRSEWNYIKRRIRDISTLLKKYGFSSRSMMYVGQGTGEFDWDGNPTFGQRDPYRHELASVIQEFYNNNVEFGRYFFWSKSYSNENVWREVWAHIRDFEFQPPKDPRKPSIFRRIINFLKNLL